MTDTQVLEISPIRGMSVAITGATGGIGGATARMLAGLGAKLVLGARRPDQLDALVAEIHASGGTAEGITADVTSRADLEKLVGAAMTSHGRLDVLINNAGIGPISPMINCRVEDWDKMIDVNLRGPLYGMAAALPHFAAQGRGHIVNVISTAGLQLSPTMAVYAGTKNALRTITETLRQENVPGLRVTGVSPGFVNTDFSQSMTDPTIREQVRASAAEMGLAPEAVARSIVHAIGQPPEVEVGDLVVRPTVQA